MCMFIGCFLGKQYILKLSLVSECVIGGFGPEEILSGK